MVRTLNIQIVKLLKQVKNFKNSIKQNLKKNNCIVVMVKESSNGKVPAPVRSSVKPVVHSIAKLKIKPVIRPIAKLKKSKKISKKIDEDV